MGIDWETILGASGADLQDAYDDCIARADAMEKKYPLYDHGVEAPEEGDLPFEDTYTRYLHFSFVADGRQGALEELLSVVERIFEAQPDFTLDISLCAYGGESERFLDLKPFLDKPCSE